MFKVALLLAVLPALAFALDVSQCSNGAPKPTSILTDSCESLPCTFINHSPVGFAVEFTAEDDSDTLTLEIDTKIGPLTLPYRVPEDVKDGCNSLTDGACPVVSGESYGYEVEFELDSLLGNVDVVLNIRLVGDNGRVIVCAEFPAHIQ